MPASVQVSLPGPTAVDPLSAYCIGLKLRTMRAAKHLTLAQLARQTGLSTALLSKLENDRMVPTLQTLERICRIYGLNLGHLFCEPKHHSVAITRREDAVPGQEHPLARLTPLKITACDHLMESQIVDLPAGVSITLGECGSITETTAHVLEGTLRVCFVGASEVLRAGDSIVLGSDQPVLWSADGEFECRFLCVSVTRPQLSDAR